MGTRIELQEMLEQITPNVYYQPPSTISIKYPCIVYTRRSIETDKAPASIRASPSTSAARSFTNKVISRILEAVLVGGALFLKVLKPFFQIVDGGAALAEFLIHHQFTV